MKKLLICAILAVPSLAHADWMLNPYTQRQDYYERATKNSSSTVIADWSSAQTSFASCVTGSTITVTLSTSSRVEVNFRGAVGADTQDMRFFSYRLDGVLADSGEAVISVYSPATFHAIVMRDITATLSSGTHTFCLVAASAGGSVYIYRTGPSSNKFWVNY